MPKEIFGRVWKAHRACGVFGTSDLTDAEIAEALREGQASLDAIVAAPPMALDRIGIGSKGFTAAMLQCVLPRREEAERAGLQGEREALLARIEQVL